MEEQDKNEDLWCLREAIMELDGQMKKLEQELQKNYCEHIMVLEALQDRCDFLVYHVSKAYAIRAKEEDEKKGSNA